MKRRRRKAAAVLLSGGLLLGSGSCVPNDFWSELAADLITTASETIVKDALDDTLDPTATKPIEP